LKKNNIDYEKVLKEIEKEVLPFMCDGEVASYIAPLAGVNPNQFAMSLQFLDGREYHKGASQKKFSIQSISKVFSFAHIMKLYKGDLQNRLGLEPSGNPFNSLVLLEYENGVPRNPFINAGAIVVADMLISYYKNNTFDKVLEHIRLVGDTLNVDFDNGLYQCEKISGYRNYSMVNMMKSFGNIKNSIDDVMSLYFKLCSIEMNTKELCRTMLFLANHGVNPITKDVFLTSSQAKRVNALMLTCGHYDASGDFAYRVGIPAKSGVGGGIVAIIPGLMSLCVYSPRLNKKGNSLVGTKALELFTTKTGLSIF